MKTNLWKGSQERGTLACLETIGCYCTAHRKTALCQAAFDPETSILLSLQGDFIRIAGAGPHPLSLHQKCKASPIQSCKGQNPPCWDLLYHFYCFNFPVQLPNGSCLLLNPVLRCFQNSCHSSHDPVMLEGSETACILLWPGLGTLTHSIDGSLNTALRASVQLRELFRQVLQVPVLSAPLGQHERKTRKVIISFLLFKSFLGWCGH